jgi:ATP sulfurylase
MVKNPRTYFNVKSLTLNNYYAIIKELKLRLITMTKLPAIFDFHNEIVVEVEDKKVSLIQVDEKWFINFASAFAHHIGTRVEDVLMIELIPDPGYFDGGDDGQIINVTGKLSIIKEVSNFDLDKFYY